LIFVSAFTVPTYPNPLNVNVNTVPITTNFFLKSILHFFSLIFYGHTTQLIISIALITTSSYYKNMTFSFLFVMFCNNTSLIILILYLLPFHYQMRKLHLLMDNVNQFYFLL